MPRRFTSSLPLVVAIAMVAATATGCTAGTGDTMMTSNPLDPRRCSPDVKQVADEGQMHLPEGTPITYKNNPPASGSHWPVWQQPWGAYLHQVIPRERWVHNLEHGGIVLLYNCPYPGGAPDLSQPTDAAASDPCPDVTSALQLLHDELKPNRFGDILVLVTADPLLPSKVAAVAWDYTLVSDHVDLQALRCFRDARYDHGPEKLD